MGVQQPGGESSGVLVSVLSIGEPISSILVAFFLLPPNLYQQVQMTPILL
jgi:hypothetical protein